MFEGLNFPQNSQKQDTNKIKLAESRSETLPPPPADSKNLLICSLSSLRPPIVPVSRHQSLRESPLSRVVHLLTGLHWFLEVVPDPSLVSQLCLGCTASINTRLRLRVAKATPEDYSIAGENRGGHSLLCWRATSPFLLKLPSNSSFILEASQDFLKALTVHTPDVY